MVLHTTKTNSGRTQHKVFREDLAKKKKSKQTKQKKERKKTIETNLGPI